MLLSTTTKTSFHRFAIHVFCRWKKSHAWRHTYIDSKRMLLIWWMTLFGLICFHDILYSSIIKFKWFLVFDVLMIGIWISKFEAHRIYLISFLFSFWSRDHFEWLFKIKVEHFPSYAARKHFYNFEILFFNLVNEQNSWTRFVFN